MNLPAREIARYSIVSALWLGVTGVATHVVYPLAVPAAPHPLVVLLYVVSAAALLEGLLCDRWQMMELLLWWVAAFFHVNTSSTVLGGSLPPPPVNVVEELRAQLQEHAARIARVEEELDATRKETQDNAARVAELEAEVQAAKALTVREICGATVEAIAVVLTVVASVIWAANLA